MGKAMCLQGNLCTLMYVLCHNAFTKHFDLTMGFGFCAAAFCKKSFDLIRVCLKSSHLMSAWIRNDQLHPLKVANNSMKDLKSYAGPHNYEIRADFISTYTSVNVVLHSCCWGYWLQNQNASMGGGLRGSTPRSWEINPGTHVLSVSPTTNGHSMDLTMTP